MPRPLELPCTFDPVEHAYLDAHGKRHRSVTQILADAGLVDFSMVDPVVLAAASERGRLVHDYTAKWDQIRHRLIRLDDMLSQFSVPEHLHGYLYQYERFLAETGFVAIAQETERPRLVEVHGTLMGMTPDRVGYFPGQRRLAVIDLKTGLYLIPHALQIAGYSMGLERVLTLAMQHDRIALYLEPGDYRLRHYHHKNDYHAFLDAMRGGGKYLDHWIHNRQRKLIA